MRSFIRHPSDIPIDFQLQELVAEGTDLLKNVSHGGLAFDSKLNLDKGAIIRISIPLINPVFEALGRVTWCNSRENRFEVGVEFVEEDNIFLARMVEQICQIEHYKEEILQQEGRNLTSEEAALEWIAKFADDFPAIKW